LTCYNVALSFGYKNGYGFYLLLKTLFGFYEKNFMLVSAVNKENIKDFVFISLKKRIKTGMFFAGCLFFLLTSLGMASGKTTSNTGWQRLETAHTIIYYTSFQDLKRLKKRVDYDLKQCGLFQSFSCSGSDKLNDEVTKRVDAVYERVQDIMGMRTKTEKVIIKIFSNKKQLQAAYRKLNKEAIQNYQTSISIRAFYIQKNDTIYLNIDDLHEGMLAHEMAHAIIGRYFLVRPPRSTAEILAQYVDKHLFE
jgi:hypothetical protein